MAALLVDALKLEELFSGRIPVESEVERLKPEIIPIDVKGSPFEPEIVAILKFGIRGLEISYDATYSAYLFRPNNPITRKELALLLEDILIKLIGEERLATKYETFAQLHLRDLLFRR